MIGGTSEEHDTFMIVCLLGKPNVIATRGTNAIAINGKETERDRYTDRAIALFGHRGIGNSLAIDTQSTPQHARLLNTWNL